MGIGYGLTEEVQVKDGLIQNPRLSEYIVPTTLDMPKIDVNV